jgi:hypothetical protein
MRATVRLIAIIHSKRGKTRRLLAVIRNRVQYWRRVLLPAIAIVVPLDRRFVLSACLSTVPNRLLMIIGVGASER